MLLSKQHGVNPSVNLCFWCGESKEITPFGASYKGEAPRNVCMDYEPCDKCKTDWKQGIVLIEVEEKPLLDNRPPIDSVNGLYPTGRFWVMTRDSIQRMITGNMLEEILKKGRAYINQEIVSLLGLDTK